MVTLALCIQPGNNKNMPFVSRDLLRLSLSALRQPYSPLLIISVPCMLAAKVPTASTVSHAQKVAVPFGAKEEREWLERYFRSPGGPVGKPYFHPGTGEWVQERYPDRSLQRRRKDFDGTVFHHPSEARWAFRKDAASTLHRRVVEEKPLIPLVALMAWMWRHENLKSIDAALKNFIAEMGVARDGFIGEVYSDQIAPDFRDAGLADAPLTDDEISELLGASPGPPSMPPVDVLVANLKVALERRKYIASDGLLERIVGGWLVGDVVVLVGAPGSGKTLLARVLAEGLEEVFAPRFLSAFLEVSPDYDLAQFLGYENLAGEFSAGRFAKEALFVGEVSDPRLIVLDEWNLAQIDSYFAPILSSIETGAMLHLPGRVRLSELTQDEQAEIRRAQPGIGEGQWILPTNSLFLATCNSWTDEPESRLPISGPVKRRCRIIQMPNVLDLQYREKGPDGLVFACNTILEQEALHVQARSRSGESSIWDSHRTERLASFKSFDLLPEQVQQKLIQLMRVLLEAPDTRSVITPGILRDILLSCVFSRPGREFEALGQQVADKILHQVLGDTKVLESLVELTRDLPNADEISDMARRMGAYGSERRIRPLV